MGANDTSLCPAHFVLTDVQEKIGSSQGKHAIFKGCFLLRKHMHARYSSIIVNTCCSGTFLVNICLRKSTIFMVKIPNTN
jgi:hypothetical protein